MSQTYLLKSAYLYLNLTFLIICFIATSHIKLVNTEVFLQFGEILEKKYMISPKNSYLTLSISLNMKFRRAIVIMFSIFFGSILLQIIFGLKLLTDGKLYSDQLSDFFINIMKIYSVHVSILFAGSFFKQLEDKVRMIDPTVFWISVSISAVWNGILIGSSLIMFFIAPVDDYHTVLDFQNKVAESSSFLITGLLSYFFVSKTQT